MKERLSKQCLVFLCKLIKIPTSNLRYADDTTLMAESEEEVESLFLNEDERGE